MDTYEIRRGLYHSILQEDFDECLGSLIEWQLCKYSQGFYKERRIFHKRNVEKFRKKIDIPYPYQVINKRNTKRVVLVADQLIGNNHSVTQVVLNFAYALQERLGYEVMIFVCSVKAGQAEKELCKFWYDAVSSNLLGLSFPIKKVYHSAVFKGYQFDMNSTYIRDYSLMMDYIYEWNPVCVLNFGTINPVVDLISDFTTLVSMEMSITCPVSESSILLRLGRMDEKTEAEYIETLNENQKQIFIDEKMPVIMEKSQKNFTREKNGLPEDKFLIAIVGNRLDFDIDDTFIQIMNQILEECENVAFVIIGEEKFYGFVKEKIGENPSVFWLGYCEDLMATYGMVDLYLNPIRGGGGFSSVMALAAGVPVITLPNCDVATNVGEDFIVADIEEMIAQVHRYVEDKDFYNEKKVCAEQVAQQNSMEKMEQYVKNIMDKIFEHMAEEERTC